MVRSPGVPILRVYTVVTKFSISMKNNKKTHSFSVLCQFCTFEIIMPLYQILNCTYVAIVSAKST